MLRVRLINKEIPELEGLDRDFVCGLVLVSGAGYDPEDEETYSLGASRGYFEKRFATGDDGWARASSVVRAVDGPTAPALVMNAEGEPPTFRRQANLIHERIAPLAPASRRLEVPGLDHERIVVRMSGAESAVSEATLAFLEERRCTAAGVDF